MSVLFYWCFFLCMISFLSVSAQEENASLYQGKQYLDLNIRSLEKYNLRARKQQDRLLNKLRHKEQRYASRLKRKDSAAYVRYQQQPLTYDSISKLSKSDNSTTKKRSTRRDSNIDSLKKIQGYLQKIPLTEGKENNAIAGYNDKLNSLDSKSNQSSYINDLISQRTNGLKNIQSGAKGKVSGFTGIEKQVFYAKSKLGVYKQISEDPSIAEEKALEYLQGLEGFDKSLQQNDALSQFAGKNPSSSDLEKMGIQTKQQVTANLQKKFGGDLSGLQQNMGGQVKQFQDKLQNVKSAKNSLKETKQSANQLRNINKPSFKVNQMRGLPFRQRIEKQYNWQTSRATIDGKPAMMQLSAMAGFKHTPKLTYGAGIATSIGLGQNWNNIKFSLQGIGIRTFASWQWQYGIGAYTGYERMFRQTAFISNAKETIPALELNTHNTKNYTEAVLIGLTKSYRINHKWNGSLQLLYDVWWRDKGLRSPIQLRLATMKN